jgi:hypothetical protein
MRTSSDRIEKDIKICDPEYKNMKLSGILRLNSADKIRVERFDEESIKDNDIYEFVLLEHTDLLDQPFLHVSIYHKLLLQILQILQINLIVNLK